MGFDNFFEETVEEFNYDEKRKELIDNLDTLKHMSVEEATLYKKWQEFNKEQDFHKYAYKFDVLRKKIWTPTDINNYDLTVSEIEALNPIIEIVDSTNQTAVENWTLLRRLIHTMEYVANPGRNIKVIAKDKNTGKVLGMMSLGSDVTSIAARDSFIGWTKDNKFTDGRLRCTSIGTSIVATQPTGVKQQLLGYIFRELGIRKADYDHGYKRGIYFSMFYENGKEYLQNNLDDSDLIMRKKFAEGYDYINKWWKRKAIRRYTKLHSENRLKPEILYYSDILNMTWEDCKEKYLGEVGR